MWQPIESAPRDGEVIDLWVSGEFEGRRPDCYWGMPHHCCGEMGGNCDSDWHDIRGNGWVDSGINEMVWEEPTHWMKIPEGPIASSLSNAVRGRE